MKKQKYLFNYFDFIVVTIPILLSRIWYDRLTRLRLPFWNGICLTQRLSLRTQQKKAILWFRLKIIMFFIIHIIRIWLFNLFISFFSLLQLNLLLLLLVLFLRREIFFFGGIMIMIFYWIFLRSGYLNYNILIILYTAILSKDLDLFLLLIF